MEKSRRLLSLDILRGITVAGMILVNNGWGESFHALTHSEWNGMTPCDMVFPFFMFIMGISTYLSLSKYQFHPTVPALRKIIKRTVLLFLIGLFVNWFDLIWTGDLGFQHLRIWAVLQRIAVCYCLVSLYALCVNHRYLLPTIIGILVGYTLILACGNGYAADSSNIAAKIDLSLFGYDHLYHKSPIDPEGLLGILPSTAHVMIGFYCGKLLKQTDDINRKVMNFFIVGTILLTIGFLLSQFGLPLNKRIWSPSFVFVTCGAGALLQGLLMYIIDIKGQQKWCGFFHIFGINPLFLYVASELLAILFGHTGISKSVYTAIHALIPSLPWASLTYALCFVLLNFLLGYPLFKKKIYIKL